ncbi:hypothetical protein EJB05_25293 [Eragrostis curvula]|uniref:Putative gamma-glutamylcyclotransferase n=1 Tax=Eragrostis curvula TaxID=38414 RepID=A0A5J9VBM1_9POAL|nr:hypothetical protein EJB05_25293 [Eragrostis curvula]
MASPPPAPAATGPNSVFVYGTLMAEEVVRILLSCIPPSAPALLPNHQRFSIKGRVYPAILPVQGQQVNGKVFKDLTDRELEVFDLFEDEEYVRKTVEVSLTVSAFQPCRHNLIAHFISNSGTLFFIIIISCVVQLMEDVWNFQDTSEKLLVYAYIWVNPSDPDLFGEWDFEEWRKVHLKDYLEMTQEFMDELEKSESKP